MSDQTQLIPGNSLTVKIARLTIKITQPNSEVRDKLRPVYANDAAMLISIGQTVAMEFATISKANNFWR